MHTSNTIHTHAQHTLIYQTTNDTLMNALYVDVDTQRVNLILTTNYKAIEYFEKQKIYRRDVIYCHIDERRKYAGQKFNMANELLNL